MSTQQLSSADQDFIQNLSAIDFGPIAFKLMNPEEGTGWTLEQTTRAIEGYRRFLWLKYLYPQKAIVPSREVDKVWHTHILDTEKYREDCDQLFGCFLDHFQYFGMRGQEDYCALEEAYRETQTLYKKHFATVSI